MSYKDVPLWQFFVCMSVIATGPLCLVFVCSWSFYFSVPREGCALLLWPFLGNFIYILERIGERSLMFGCEINPL